MHNRATKKQAVQLINQAIKDGWKREINCMDYNGVKWHVMVSLTKIIYFRDGGIKQTGHIIVSFRKSKRGWVNSIANPTQSENKTYRGLWGANYTIRNMRETEQRQINRNIIDD